jgi:hypothetical protein
MPFAEIALRLAGSLAGALCTYAAGVALLLSDSFSDFFGRFVGSLRDLIAGPLGGDALASPFTPVPYVFVIGMAAFYFCFPLIADLIRRRAGLR